MSNKEYTGLVSATLKKGTIDKTLVPEPGLLTLFAVTIAPIGFPIPFCDVLILPIKGFKSELYKLGSGPH